MAGLLFSGTSRSSPRRRRITGTLLTVAQFGYAHWFFGNLYEAVVKVPDRLAGEPAARGGHATAMLGPGSPVRYYLPGIPITLGATIGALVTGRNAPSDRRWLAAAAAGTISGYAATAYLVRTVNLRLFFADQPVTPAERDRLLRTWYRLNMFRLAAAGGAWLAARQARARTRPGE